MSKRSFGALALAAIVAAMLFAAQGDAAEAERIQVRYCENVVTWRVQADRGVHPHDRTGHPDFKQVAAEACPGMYPAE